RETPQDRGYGLTSGGSGPSTGKFHTSARGHRVGRNSAQRGPVRLGPVGDGWRRTCTFPVHPPAPYVPSRPVRIAVVPRKKLDAEGTVPLFVRISHGNRKRYVSLGIRIPRADWNPRKREVRASNPHADQLNDTLRERRATAE